MSKPLVSRDGAGGGPPTGRYSNGQTPAWMNDDLDLRERTGRNWEAERAAKPGSSGARFARCRPPDGGPGRG